MRTFSVTDEDLEQLFVAVMPHLDERQRRILAASTAVSLGYGGIVAVAEATSMSRSTVQSAINEIDSGLEVTGRVRRPGAGSKKITDSQPGLVQALDDLVEPDARGCPMSPLRWTAKSTRTLADALCAQGFQVSHNTVYLLLAHLGYSLQSPLKSVEGKQHPDRDEQFDLVPMSPLMSLVRGPFEDSKMLLRARTLDFTSFPSPLLGRTSSTIRR